MTILQLLLVLGILLLLGRTQSLQPSGLIRTTQDLPSSLWGPVGEHQVFWVVGSRTWSLGPTTNGFWMLGRAQSLPGPLVGWVVGPSLQDLLVLLGFGLGTATVCL